MADNPNRQDIRQGLATALKETVEQYASGLRELRKREIRHAQKKGRLAKTELCPLCGNPDQPGTCTCLRKNSLMGYGEGNPGNAGMAGSMAMAEKPKPRGESRQSNPDESDWVGGWPPGVKSFTKEPPKKEKPLLNSEMCATHGKDLQKCGPSCREEMKKQEFLDKACLDKAWRAAGPPPGKRPPLTTPHPPKAPVPTAGAEEKGPRATAKGEDGWQTGTKKPPEAGQEIKAPGAGGKVTKVTKSESPLRKDVAQRAITPKPFAGALPGMVPPGASPRSPTSIKAGNHIDDAIFDELKTPQPARSRRKSYSVPAHNLPPTKLPGMVPPGHPGSASASRPPFALPKLEPAPTRAAQANSEMGNFKPIATSPVAPGGGQLVNPKQPASLGKPPTPKVAAFGSAAKSPSQPSGKTKSARFDQDAELAADKKAGGVGWLNSLISKFKGAGNKTWEALRGAGPASEGRIARTIGMSRSETEAVDLRKHEWVGSCAFCHRPEHRGNCS